MRKILWPLLIGAALLLSGCGSNDFDEPGKGKYDTNSTLTENNGTGNNGQNDGNDSNKTDSTPSNSDLIAKYRFFNATTPVTITKEGREYIIGVQLLYDGLVAPDKTVILKPFEDVYGKVVEYSTTTGKDGYALFHYTAPNKLPADGTKATLTLLFKNQKNQSISKNIELIFNKSVDTVDTYRFMNLTNTITINTPEQEATISVIVVDSDGVGQPNQQVTATAPAIGTIDKSVATTGANGVATFIYKAPDEKQFENKTATILLKNNYINNPETVTVQLQKNAVVSEYRLINASDVIVSDGTRPRDISVQLIDKNNIPVAGQQIVSQFIDKKFGYLKTATVTTGADGYARFVWMPPEKKPDENATTITFSHFTPENGAEANTTAQLTFDVKNEWIPAPNTPKVYIQDTGDVKDRNAKVNQNGQAVTVKVCTYKDNQRYTEGNVSIQLDSKALNGTDIGSFDRYSDALDSKGCSEFLYTAPYNLTHTIEDNKISEVTFTFVHSESDQNDSNNILTVLFEKPDNQTDYNNYYVTLLADKFSMELDQKKSFGVKLKGKDTNGNEIDPDVNISKITVSSLNPSIAKPVNPDTNATDEEIVLSDDTTSFIMQSGTKSGLVPVKVSIEFKDIGGTDRNATIVTNIRVFSGPPTAISISYVGVTQDKERAKYVETLAISVTDEYGNKVNTEHPNFISVGAIVGYTVDGGEPSGKESNETKRLFYGKSAVDSGQANGEIADPDSNHKTSFADTTVGNRFQYVNAEGPQTDKLVVFGERKNYEAMGKWDIGSVNGSTLGLVDDYFGQRRDGLYYAVGHNYYQDLCREDGREWIGSTDTEETNTTLKLDDQGTAIVTYKYDYHLTGKDAMIWVNLIGHQPDDNKTIRLGEASKHTLRGNGLTAVPESFSIAPGAHRLVQFDIHHKNAPEWYRNGHFGSAVKSDCTVVRLVMSSNEFDARTCQVSKRYVATETMDDYFTIQYPADDNGTVISSWDYNINSTGDEMNITLTLENTNGLVTDGIVTVSQNEDSSLIKTISNVTNHHDGTYSFVVSHDFVNTRFDTVKNISNSSFVGESEFKITAERTSVETITGNGDGTAFAIFYVENHNTIEACTIRLERVVPSREF